MPYIRVTKDNLESEHICCAISNNKDIQVSSKKAWLAERFDEGLVFLKSEQRGKCFIEYIPAENAWNPIDADGYMYIDCLWVSGSLKGHGYSNDLLNELCVFLQEEKQRAKRVFAYFQAQRKSRFLLTRNILLTKALRFATRLQTAFSCGICHLIKMQKNRSSSPAQKTCTPTKRAMCCIIPASARSMQNISPLSSRPQSSRACSSGRCTSPISRPHRTHPHR